MTLNQYIGCSKFVSTNHNISMLVASQNNPKLTKCKKLIDNTEFHAMIYGYIVFVLWKL
jgi:hypothetical protein